MRSGFSALGRRLAAPGIPLSMGRAADRAWLSTGDWPTVRQATLLWLATRVALVIFTVFAVPFNAQRAHGPFSHHPFPPSTLLASWNRWDTQWYERVATAGYHGLQTAAFFPLYPLLVRLLAAVIGLDHLTLAALIVANGAALAAFIAVALLARQELGAEVAPSAVRAFAAFPLAFFLAGGYSDGLFLALATFSLLLGRRGNWPMAAACAVLATWTRIFGVALILPLLWEYARQRHDGAGTWRALVQARTLLGLAGVAAAVPAALLLWSLYLWHQFGDPLAYLTANRRFWDHVSLTPWQWISSAITTMQHLPPWTFAQERALFDLLPIVVVVLLTAVGIRRLPAYLSLYLLGILAVVFTSSIPLNFVPFSADGRYMLVATPVFLLLGRWMARRPSLDLLIVGGGFLLQGLFTAFFLRGGWLV